MSCLTLYFMSCTGKCNMKIDNKICTHNLVLNTEDVYKNKSIFIPTTLYLLEKLSLGNYVKIPTWYRAIAY